MKFTTILTAITLALTLAVTATLLPLQNNREREDESDFFSVTYSYDNTVPQIEDFDFSLPEFISLDQRSGDNDKKRDPLSLSPDKVTTTARIKRPSTPRIGQFAVEQAGSAPTERKFGDTVALQDPIAEFLESGSIGGVKLDPQKLLALQVEGNDDLKGIHVVETSDLRNPDETVRELLALSPRLLPVSKPSSENKPVSLQIYDLLQPGTDQYLNTRKLLLSKCNSGNCSDEELKAVGFLLMNEGDYNAGYEMYGKIGSSSLLGSDILLSGEGSEGGITFEISGKVLDNRSRGVRGALVKSLDGSAETVTDTYGNYSITLTSIFDLYKVRLNASKEGYSTATIPLELITSEGLYNRTITGLDFVLESPLDSVTLNNQTGETDGSGAFVEGENFIVTTSLSRYEIPFDAFVRADGTSYRGELEMYLFEFDKDSDIGQLLMNDVFDDVAGYAGNIMKTFGMPFVLFVNEDGDTLHILKSNPMLLRNQISEMEALRTNEDQVYEPLTDADMIFLKAQSDELGGYPIDRSFLIDNGLVRFPAFWVYDQLKGIWENIGVKILSTDGEIETIFYTLNDVD